MAKTNNDPVTDPVTPAVDTVQISKEELEGLKSVAAEFQKFRTETEDYLKGATVVVNTLASDPELTRAFKAKMGVVDEGGQPSQQPQQTQTQTPSPANDGGQAQKYSADISEVKASQKEEIVSAFEREYGISSLPDDKKRETRQKLESYLNDFGWSISGQGGSTPPLTALRSHLEKAYVGTHAEKLREEGKLEGFVQARTNDMGAMGSFPSGTINTEGGERDLTPAQKKWAEKFGVNIEKAKKTYLEKDSEESRVSGAEKRAEESQKAQ